MLNTKLLTKANHVNYQTLDHSNLFEIPNHRPSQTILNVKYQTIDQGKLNVNFLYSVMYIIGPEKSEKFEMFRLDG